MRSMKFKATFKTPDALERAIFAAAEAEHRTTLDESGVDAWYEMSAAERYPVIEARVLEIGGAAEKFLQHGEYLTVEFDLDLDTCTVVRPV